MGIEYDETFLKKLDEMRIRVLYSRIILLSFDELPIAEIQGNITSGSLTVNGNSSVRRTISLSMMASYDNNKIEDVDNAISINKKVRVEVGYKNPFSSYVEKYGETIWFPCGVFILSSAQVLRSTSGWTISISGKDKMCLLDGSVGGTLPASTTFHEKYTVSDDGDITVEYPTIFTIIQEAVNHFGNEPIDNIFISDIDDTARMIIKYVGDVPIYFNTTYTTFTRSLDEAMSWPEGYEMFSYNDDVGYKKVDFTYPGELILNAGDTVESLLSKISSTLGNYEYFYDIDGRFIFLEIKNYLNSTGDVTSLEVEDYTRNYSNTKYMYSITDFDTTTSITKNPKYDLIKNDYVAWGVRTTAAGSEVDIRYHLVIDKKPLITVANKYMYAIVNPDDTSLIIRYEFSESADVTTANAVLVGIPCDEWREELYRQALVASITNGYYSYYDSELIAEWRKLYDTMDEDWTAYNHWNPDVFNDPKVLDYWLDFIDEGTEIGKYSVSSIGRRTKVINDSAITAVYANEIPDIIFMDSFDANKIKEFNSYGLLYFILKDEYSDLFLTSSTGSSAFDKIREALYLNLNYNTTILLTCLPKYYLEPNNVIYIQDKASGIAGNYVISLFTLPLAYSGTMSITATELLSRV